MDPSVSRSFGGSESEHRLGGFGQSSAQLCTGHNIADAFPRLHATDKGFLSLGIWGRPTI